jgi:hypothetical protein
MLSDKDSALLGYIAGMVVLIPFFWLTLGDAYGRFMVVFDPANSMVSQQLEYYTKGLTGLVSLVTPFLLAYLPRYVIGRWVGELYDFSGRLGLWLLQNANKLTVLIWRKASNAVRTLSDAICRKMNERGK